MTLGDSIRAAAVVAAIVACGLAIRGSSGPTGAAPSLAARRAPPRPGARFLRLVREADRAWREEDSARAAGYVAAASREEGADERCERLLAICSAAETTEQSETLRRFGPDWDEVVSAWGLPEPFPGCALPWPEDKMREIRASERAVRLPGVFSQADTAFRRGEYARARDYCRQALRLGGERERTGQLIQVANQLEHCSVNCPFGRLQEEWNEALAALTVVPGR